MMTTVAMTGLGTFTFAHAQDATTPTVSASPLLAQQPAPPPYTPPPAPPLYAPAAWVPDYHSQEVSADLFASGNFRDDHHYNYYYGYHEHHNARAGGGLGLNYFFSRYVGVGADTYTEDRDPAFIYAASGNVIGRFPIGETGLAPYVFGGGGHQWDFSSQNFGQAGAGVEFRFARNLGVFVDGRAVIPDRGENYGLIRGGLRIVF